MEALRGEAFRYGLQLGLSWQYGLIEKDLVSRESMLDSTFRFDGLLLENGTVQPPVLVKADSSVTLENNSKMVTTKTAWKIESPAKFVSNPPSWRTYLLVPEDAMEVQSPYAAMLPKSSDERAAWKAGVTEGWDYGVKQAQNMFKEAMAKLKREYLGMVEYHQLSRQGKISIPNISRGHFAVRVGKNTLEMDQETFIITDQSQFQEQKNWHPAER